MDYNFSRGKISFWEIINKELENFEQDQQNRIKEIAKSFEDSVAIMPDEDNNIYAAKRLANSILNTDLSNQKEGSIDTITSNVLVKYFSIAQSNATISKCHFVPENANITGKFGKFAMAEADNFETELRANFEQEIDLLEDLNSSDLSVEGLRKKLIVPIDFNSDQQDVPEVENSEVLGSITFNSDGAIEKVTCPTCSESDVYFIAHDKFGCFQCDKEFKVPMEIADSLK